MVIDKPVCNIESNTYIDNSLNVYIESPKIKVRQWTTVANMNTARYKLSAFVIDGKGYVCGGEDGFSYSTVNTVEKYDTVTDTWTTVANMNIGRRQFTAFSIDGKGYVCGGVTGILEVVNTAECYDPSTNTWVYVANMNDARYAPTSFVVDGKGYVCGGANISSTLISEECYNPTTNTWSYISNIHTRRCAASAFVIDGKGYVSGGTGYGSGVYDIRSVEKYDPITNTWVYVANMNNNRSYASAFSIDGKGYVCGGVTINITNTVEKYDPITNTWVYVANMNNNRSYASAFSIDGKGYVCGGLKTNTGVIIDVDCYGSITLDAIVDTYYTLDNTTPKTTSNRFSNEFRIYKDTILKAKAISGSDESEVLTVDIKFDKLITQSDTLTNTLLFAPDLIYKDPYYDKFKQIEHTLKLEGDDTE